MPGSATVTVEAAALLAALANGDWAVADASDDRTRRSASGLVTSYLHWHIERNLRSMPLVERA
jgi:DNA repair protein RecO (recombination protein O)